MSISPQLYSRAFILLTGLMLTVGAVACGDSDEAEEPAENSAASNNTGEPDNSGAPNNGDALDECQEDGDCAGEDMFCDEVNMCAEDVFAGDTRTAEAAFVLREDGLHWFGGVGTETCSRWLRLDYREFGVTLEMLEGEVGSVFTLDDGLVYPGQSSDENAAFNLQAVEGSFEITARGEGTIAGKYSFEIADVSESDFNSDRNNNNPDDPRPDYCATLNCFTESGTFDAIICTP